MSDCEPPFDLSTFRQRVAGQSGARLWRTLEDLADTAAGRRFVQAEFPDLARSGPVDRRTLLGLMAAALAAGGVAACSEEREPLLSRPEGVPAHLRGKAIIFATTLELGGHGRGVLVRTHDGRPTKIEGNPHHPASLGASDAYAQAEILALYDPDRSRAPRWRGTERTWADVERFIRPERSLLVANKGRGLHILTEPVASPTMTAVMDAVREAFPAARWHHYSPIMDDHARRGAIMAFGQPVDVVPDLGQADAILCLGGDLFLDAPGHIRHAADFARRRRDALRLGTYPRLFVAEATPGITGARADHRIVLHPRQFEAFARDVAAALEGRAAADGAAHPAAAAIAADLGAAGRRALVVAGREQAPVVHALVHAMNAKLGAPGSTLRYIAPVSPASEGEIESLLDLAEAIAAGAVSHLLVLGGNPAYDAPADLEFADLLRRVPVSAHLGTHFDETSASCGWHIPRLHALESWGDLRAFDGTVGLRQPTTMPLFRAFTPEEVLGMLLGRVPDGRDLVRTFWQNQWADESEATWLQTLEAGVVPGTAFPPLAVRLRDDFDPGLAAPAGGDGITAVFSPDPSIWDGRFANNAWLQELPKPLSKLVWGNAALIAPATAAALGLATGDVAELSAGEARLRAPVWIMPGQAPDTVALPLGHGRWAAGLIGNGIGFDAYRLRPSGQPWFRDGVRITPTGARYRLISTQGPHAMERGDLVRVVGPGDLAAAGGRAERLPSFYPEYPSGGYAWGMAVDLDACIGCNACVIACQSENNVPVVGPEEAARGRIMHWLRVDRYHADAAEDAATFFQPVPCMHCEKAPCEVVCPVFATVHGSEGLNEMVYNRCIGTRTCANNCPYQVRRFNWFDYAGKPVNAAVAAPNPEVTIRGRGVMEKCTYCVQRISAARIEAKLQDRPIRDGEIQTACQQACPTQAIVFGDVNDPDSAVSRVKASPRNYALLGELNTQPRTTYLARIANRNEGVGTEG